MATLKVLVHKGLVESNRKSHCVGNPFLAAYLRDFDALCRGVVDLADVGYYVGVMAFMLVAAQVVTDSRKAS